MHSAVDPHREAVNAAESSQCPREAAGAHLLEEAVDGVAEDCMDLPLKIFPLIFLPFSERVGNFG